MNRRAALPIIALLSACGVPTQHWQVVDHRAANVECVTTQGVRVYSGSDLLSCERLSTAVNILMHTAKQVDPAIDLTAVRQAFDAGWPEIDIQYGVVRCGATLAYGCYDPNTLADLRAQLLTY